MAFSHGVYTHTLQRMMSYCSSFVPVPRTGVPMLLHAVRQSQNCLHSAFSTQP